MADEEGPPLKKTKTNPEHISRVVLTLAESVRALVREVERKMGASSDVNSFILTGLGTLGRAIGLYAMALADLSITTFSEFDRLVRESFKSPEVCESFEELLSAEEDWTSFLGSVEKRMVESEGTTIKEGLKEGETLPMDMNFIQVDSKEKISLSQLTSGASGRNHKYLLLVLLRHLA